MARPVISFTTIVPKKGFLFDLFDEVVTTAMENKVRPDLRKLFYQTVSSWEHKVYFRGTIRRVPGKYIALTVQPYGDNKDLYALVSKGARAHEIVPKNADYLAFRTQYTAATEPMWIGSRRKRRFGPMRYAQHVFHPGFEARNFDIAIAEEYAPEFDRVMQRALFEYARRQKNAFKASQNTENPQKVERR